MTTQVKAKHFIKLVEAEVIEARDKSIHISVTVTTDPVSSVRMFFPVNQFWNDGAGNLFVTDWILTRKNQDRKAARQPGVIRVDRSKAFFK